MKSRLGSVLIAAFFVANTSRWSALVWFDRYSAAWWTAEMLRLAATFVMCYFGLRLLHGMSVRAKRIEATQSELVGRLSKIEGVVTAERSHLRRRDARVFVEDVMTDIELLEDGANLPLE